SAGHSIVPQPQGLDDLRKMLWFHDEPFHSFAAFACFKVMETARQRGIVVLLNGQGADELLGGYSSYFPHYLAHLLRHGRLSRALRAAWGARPLMRHGVFRSLAQALKVGLQGVVSNTRLMRARSRFRRRRAALRECGLAADFLDVADQQVPEEPHSPMRD